MRTTENTDSTEVAVVGGTGNTGVSGFVVRLLILGILVAALARVLVVAGWQLEVPFDLVYESPNRMTIQALGEGKNIYAASLYDAPPYWITMYTPLYHYLVSWLPGDGPHRFYSGRVLSAAFMVLAAASLLVAGRQQNRFFSLLAVGVFFLIHPVVSNTVFLKNDSAALFFSVAALLCAEKIPRPLLRVGAAALCALLALACKQSYAAAAAACLVYFWVASRRLGGLYLLIVGALAVLGGLCAQALWGSGFWFCIFQAGRNPLAWSTFAGNWALLLRQPVFLGLVLGCIVWLAALLPKGIPRAQANPWLLYFLWSGLALLALVGKTGASTNYFIEPVLAALLWLVASADHFSGSLLRRPGFHCATVLLALATGYELWTARPATYAFTTPAHTRVLTAVHQDIRQEVAALVKTRPQPRILNLYMVRLGLELPGLVCVNDPLLYRLLWQQGSLAPDTMLAAIRQQQFDLVIFPPNASLDSETGPYGQILASIQKHYRQAAIGRAQYWVPMAQQ